MILTIACPLIIAAFTSTLMWYKYPGKLLKFIYRLFFYYCGLKVRYIEDGKFRYCIAEKGKRRSDKLSVVFIHGFSTSKEIWLSVVKELPKDLHIVLLDLPGHGDTTMPSPEDDISLFALTDHVHKVLCHLKMDEFPFHLVGASLGGAIACLYGAIYPKQIAKLMLMSPAIKTPIDTDFMHEVEKGKCRLIPKTTEELQYMIDSCVHTKIKINKQILTGILQLRSPKDEFNRKLFEQLKEEAQRINPIDFLCKITAPTHVMWGKHDELFHVSGAEMLQEHLPNCQRVDVIENGGHSLDLDRPDVVAKCLMEFRGDLGSAKQNKID